MENPDWVRYWRISATSTLTNRNFIAWKLPPPNTPDYRAYSQLVPQSQGGQARQGYVNISILWDILDFSQLQTLTGIVEAAITAGTIYATVPKDDGSGSINAFIDVHGVPIPLEYMPYSNGRGVVYQSVVLKINNITIDADPSAVL